MTYHWLCESCGWCNKTQHLHDPRRCVNCNTKAGEVRNVSYVATPAETRLGPTRPDKRRRQPNVMTWADGTAW